MADAAPPSSLRIRDWDTATKFAGIVALVAGGMWSVWLYHETAKKQAAAAEIDAQKPFAAKRLEVYERLVALTAAIAQPDLPPPLRKMRRQELDQVVNGPLALVAQEKVFVALRDFYTCAETVVARKVASLFIRGTSRRSCRSSLEDSWKVALPPVPTSDALP